MSLSLPIHLQSWARTDDADVEALRDVRFTPPEQADLRLDIYRPVGQEGPLPVVLYLHGGGWRVGSRTDRERDRQIPLARLGFAVVSADYRLSGDARFPAQLDDSARALRWILGNGDAVGLDVSRVAVAGASAGAHLAALLALAGADGEGLPIPPVQAIVSWFPVTDVAGYDAEWRSAPWPEPDTFAAQGAAKRGWPPAERVAALLGVAHVEDADPAAVAAADPRSYLAAASARRTAPFLILHGDRDTAVGVHHARLLHDALRQHGIATTLLVLADADHEDAAFGRPAPLGAVAHFLRQALLVR
ncbi:alpha/beta hydrolase [Bradyrhizobium sp. U87765 SZCCT0131]|uniref:alpha/beta hydrolase n=1 Tax=unclassified Bradyrhizobium TaxID=2631580 RepID=UPI001BA58852|nr:MULTISPECIES: alpha/beta hydrolase [unclassified Bradyrhizobium]MBR1218559.1 alpha/beta hydrolase [Bradyrhizobium sp. U87765 SZCCT0131]MBR1260495.1 alpha/beta hydrolase [Bradyrhizobium sp. U87765 SZCCT0134]MBR1304057.1 alpha/beta hydrolase [Bradyrhizobium sp. U87765 SZCCT0110]MBR1319663.1 alpha/beta hydrolase [Bradyrhizobium sp. U87765 SZCCT0109]MBR1347988.1 alpha/beta hydrolase [Bradyrhizobium sp. U87765 SZCCT0048]